MMAAAGTLIERLDANTTTVCDDITLRIVREPRQKLEPASEGEPADLPEAEAKWVGRCRALGADKLRAWGLSSLAESAQLLISELVTNALRHGESTEVGVRLLITMDVVVIEVHDGSPDLPHVRHAGPDEESGRGMLLVDVIAESWGVSPDGTRTWCALSTSPLPRGSR